MKKLFYLFLILPILFTLPMGVITVFLSEIAMSFIKNPDINNSNFFLILFNFLITLLNSLLFFLLCKTICTKCNSSHSISNSIQVEWKERKNIIHKFIESKRTSIFIFFFLVIIVIFWYFLSTFICKLTNLQTNQDLTFNFQYLITPLFEEFIFRKVYFEYCDNNHIKYDFVLNVLLFAFSHIIPTPNHFLLGIILTYSYKKYKSLILTTFIHLFYNLLSMSLPLLLDYIGQCI